MSDTLYERYNTGESWDYSSTDAYWNAQTFTIGNTGANVNHNITSVKLLIYRYNTPHTLTISIRAVDVDNKPTGADLTSGTTDGDTLTTSAAGEWREIALTPYMLSAGTQYAIVLRAAAASGEGNVYWLNDDTTPTYSGGEMAYSSNSGGSWAFYGGVDNLFEEYGILIVTGQYMTSKRYW